MALVPLWSVIGIGLLILWFRKKEYVRSYFRKPKHSLFAQIPYGNHAQAPISVEILLENLNRELPPGAFARATFDDITTRFRKARDNKTGHPVGA